jgi:hypothetical protein
MNEIRCRRSGILSLVLGVALAAGCSPATPPSPLPAPITVKGIVVQQKKPVRKMLLTLTPQDSRDAERYRAATDEDGKFEMSCRPGKYSVQMGAIPVGQGGAGGPANQTGPPPTGKLSTDPMKGLADPGKMALTVTIPPTDPAQITITLP